MPSYSTFSNRRYPSSQQSFWLFTKKAERKTKGCIPSSIAHESLERGNGIWACRFHLIALLEWCAGISSSFRTPTPFRDIVRGPRSEIRDRADGKRIQSADRLEKNGIVFLISNKLNAIIFGILLQVWISFSVENSEHVYLNNKKPKRGSRGHQQHYTQNTIFNFKMGMMNFSS